MDVTIKPENEFWMFVWAAKNTNEFFLAGLVVLWGGRREGIKSLQNHPDTLIVLVNSASIQQHQLTSRYSI